jgi:hypothetical protein
MILKKLCTGKYSSSGSLARASNMPVNGIIRAEKLAV